MNGSNSELSRNGHANAASGHLRRQADAILDYAENRLPAREQQSIAQHLNACAECRDFYEQAKRLEATLERALAPPLLSSSFTGRLWNAIERQYSSDPAAAYQLQRQNIERQFEAYTTRMRKRIFGLRNLLDAIGYGIALAMAVYVVTTVTSGFAMRWLPGFEEHRGFVLSCTAGICFVIAGLGVALKRPLPE